MTAPAPVTVGKAMVGGQLVRMTAHAARRYHERVRPTLLDRSVAARDLVRVAETCGMVKLERPRWTRLASAGAEHAVEAWLMLGNDIALPIVDGYATTCLTRGTTSDKARVARSGRRHWRSEVRKAAKGQRGGKASDGRYSKNRARER